MDQSVIKSFNSRYRHTFFSKILYKQERGLITALKNLKIMYFIYIATNTYEEIPQSAFVQSWRKLWSNVEKNNRNSLEAEHNPNDVLESVYNDTVLTDLRKPDCNWLVQKDVMTVVKSPMKIKENVGNIIHAVAKAPLDEKKIYSSWYDEKSNGHKRAKESF